MKDIGFIAGAFDLCHAGHILSFKEAKKHCRYLVAALHDNPHIERNKKNVPIMSLEERKIILKGIRYIDEIILYKTESDLLKILKSVKPDIRFLGTDWKRRPYTGHELKIPIHWIDRSHGYSSSTLRHRIWKVEQDKLIHKHNSSGKI